MKFANRMDRFGEGVFSMLAQMKKKNHLKFTNRSKKLKFEKKNYHITKNSLILAGEILCVCLVAVLLIAFFG